MNIHEFTKHKWLVDSVDKSIVVEVDGGVLNIATLGHVDILEPATETLNPKFFYGPESVANAYLMRAAPKLLRALENLVLHIDLCGTDTNKQSPAYQSAQAAINSALMVTPGPKTDGDAAEFEAV